MALENYTIKNPLYDWLPLGRVMERGEDGSFDSRITGDPCIVWDEENKKWLMYYFAAGNTIGAAGLDIGMARSKSALDAGAGDWEKLGSLQFLNPGDIWQRSPHKPWILMDPFKPNRAVRVDGKYNLFFVSVIGLNKVIQRAFSASLYGPWEVQKEPVLCPDSVDGCDSYHTDTVSAYWFSKQERILLFYKGCPQYAQADQKTSPFGSCLCAAVMQTGDLKAEKKGRLLSPSADPAHWTSGWMSGIQIIPRSGGGWLGLTTASPTPPEDLYNQLYNREPNPSLGGWAWTSGEFPLGGWEADSRPIKWINELSREETVSGERVHLFRHHLLMVDSGNYYLYYNSGPYGDQQMFVHKLKA